MQTNPDAIQEAMRMAKSPAGQQLLKMLQSSGPQELNQAINKAAAGDYEAVKGLLNNFLRDPQAQELIKQMGGNHGSDGR